MTEKSRGPPDADIRDDGSKRQSRDHRTGEAHRVAAERVAQAGSRKGEASPRCRIPVGRSAAADVGFARSAPFTRGDPHAGVVRAVVTDDHGQYEIEKLSRGRRSVTASLSRVQVVEHRSRCRRRFDDTGYCASREDARGFAGPRAKASPAPCRRSPSRSTPAWRRSPYAAPERTLLSSVPIRAPPFTWTASIWLRPAMGFMDFLDVERVTFQTRRADCAG